MNKKEVITKILKKEVIPRKDKIAFEQLKEEYFRALDENIFRESIAHQAQEAMELANVAYQASREKLHRIEAKIKSQFYMKHSKK